MSDENGGGLCYLFLPESLLSCSNALLKADMNGLCDAAVVFSGVRENSGKLQPFSYLAGNSHFHLLYHNTCVSITLESQGEKDKNLLLCLEHEPEAGGRLP